MRKVLMCLMFVLLLFPLPALAEDAPGQPQISEAEEIDSSVETDDAAGSMEYSAEDDWVDYEVYTLGEIIVAEDMPAVREVSISNEVTAEQITATNSRTASEALSYVPGIEVSAGRKNEPEISIHGLEQRKTLILVDGIPYYETNYGKLDLNQIPADIIARIDVVKGAPSVLYGPNAEVGVINIITKKGTEKPTFSVTSEVGDEGYFRTSLTHGNSLGIFYYWLNYIHNESNAFPLSDDFDPKSGELVFRPGGTTDLTFENGDSRHNSYRNTDSVWAKFGVELDEDSEYYVNLSYIDTEKGMPPSLVQNRVFPNRPAFSQLARFDKYDDFNVDLGGRQRITDCLTLQGKFFYHEHVDEYVSFSDLSYDNEIAVSRFKDYYIGGSILADIQPVDWDIVRLAFHYKEDSHEERDDSYLPFAESISHTGSVAIENEFNLIDNLSLVLGVSYDWFEVTDAEENNTDGGGNFVSQDDIDTESTIDEFNPMIGAVYYFPDSTKLYGSVAQKTRFPTLSQLFSGRSGNPKLDAEKSINYTIGVSRPLREIAVADLAFFYHDIEDWISRDGPYVDSLYRNYAEINILGVEFVTEVYPMENLTLRFGYTFLDAEDNSTGAVTDNVVQIPEHKVDLGVSYEIPVTGMRIDLTGVYVDESYTQLPTPESPDTEKLKSDDYIVLNARITQPFMEHFEVYLAVNNIGDRDYEPEDGFPAPGRNYWVGITGKF